MRARLHLLVVLAGSLAGSLACGRGPAGAQTETSATSGSTETESDFDGDATVTLTSAEYDGSGDTDDAEGSEDTGEPADTQVRLLCSEDEGLIENALDDRTAYFSDASGEIFESSGFVDGVANCHQCDGPFSVSILELYTLNTFMDLTVASLPAGELSTIELCAKIDGGGFGPNPVPVFPDETPAGQVEFILPQSDWEGSYRLIAALAQPGDPTQAYKGGTFTPPQVFVAEPSAPNGGVGVDNTVGAFALVDTNFPDFTPTAWSFAKTTIDPGGNTILDLPDWSPNPTLAEFTLSNTGSLLEWGELYHSWGFNGYPLHIHRFATNTTYVEHKELATGETYVESFPVIPVQEASEAYTYLSLGYHDFVAGFFERRTPLNAPASLDAAIVPRIAGPVSTPTPDDPVLRWEFATPLGEDAVLVFEGITADQDFGDRIWWLITPEVDAGEFILPHHPSASVLESAWLGLDYAQYEVSYESWKPWTQRLSDHLRMRLGLRFYESLPPSDQDWTRWQVWADG